MRVVIYYVVFCDIMNVEQVFDLLRQEVQVDCCLTPDEIGEKLNQECIIVTVLLLHILGLTTVPAKAAITSKWPLLLCTRFSCDIYANFFSLIAKNEEVESLGCKLFGYMWGQFPLDT